jgi:hypothetical protein
VIDRHAVAYQLIVNSLRRRGLPGTLDDVRDVLERMPLNPVTRLAILMARDDVEPNEFAVREAHRQWREKSLASNPFA